MNNTSHLEEIKINYNTEEWISEFPGGITSVEVDGDKLISLRKVNKTAQVLKGLSLLLLGILLGLGCEYFVIKDNLMSTNEVKELNNMKWKSSISREASSNLHSSGVRWHKEMRKWVWRGNGLAISSHDKHEIKD